MVIYKKSQTHTYEIITKNIIFYKKKLKFFIHEKIIRFFNSFMKNFYQ